MASLIIVIIPPSPREQGSIGMPLIRFPLEVRPLHGGGALMWGLIVSSHPSSDVQAILEDHESVENLTAVEGAMVPIISFIISFNIHLTDTHTDFSKFRIVPRQVPIMSFDFDEINIDLLFATLPIDAVPADFDIDDDNVRVVVPSTWHWCCCCCGAVPADLLCRPRGASELLSCHSRSAGAVVVVTPSTCHRCFAASTRRPRRVSTAHVSPT